MTAFDMASVQPLQEDASAQTALDVYVGFSSSNVRAEIHTMSWYSLLLHIILFFLGKSGDYEEDT
ncbi:hypothetical protein EON65_35315 [archaeon]|nr:MAG: hypothetical protein EON65_35315 [archaeon]